MSNSGYRCARDGLCMREGCSWPPTAKCHELYVHRQKCGALRSVREESDAICLAH